MTRHWNHTHLAPVLSVDGLRARFSRHRVADLAHREAGPRSIHAEGAHTHARDHFRIRARVRVRVSVAVGVEG